MKVAMAALLPRPSLGAIACAPGFACRSCGHRACEEILDLGETPLANRLLRGDALGEPEPRYPLVLVFCPRCALVQITETVPPEVLFREYFYCSSFSDAFVRHAAALAERMIAARALDAATLVVEIASNDGCLLQHYQRAGVPVLGIDPARNVAEVARRQRGIHTINDFFGRALAEELCRTGHRAAVIHAHNVLAHVADLDGVVAGIGLLLGDGGVAIIEVPYVRDLVDRVEFDTIYHEHLCYFSLTALDTLFARHALVIADVERVPIHGGSLRLFVTGARDGAGSVDYARRPSGGRGGARRSASVRALLDDEAATGVTRASYYRDFGGRVAALRGALRALIYELKRGGHRIAAYGASAKGSTLLNTTGIGRGELDFVVDRSTLKQGYFTPGAHLPIHAPERLLAELPDYTLLLSWNFADEIMEQQREYTRRGGRFIVPIPTPRVVGGIEG
jgi:SAM-dependent methyltransferase